MKKSSLLVVGVIVFSAMLSHDTLVRSEPFKAPANTVNLGINVDPLLEEKTKTREYLAEMKFQIVSDGPEMVVANMQRYSTVRNDKVQQTVWVTDGRQFRKGDIVRLVEIQFPVTNIAKGYDWLLVVR